MDILDKILVQRKQQLSKEKAVFPKISLAASLQNPHNGVSILAEIKRASPSRGEIASADFNLLRQAKLYQKNGAAGFSILTEEAFFKGDNDFIARVKNKISNIPVLRKDFIFDAFQVAHAKFLQADAILLIVAMLDDNTLLFLHELALLLELEVLVEVHNSRELERALRIPSLKILGINNRDLKTFVVDLQNSKDLLTQVPQHKRDELVLVSESGYHSKEDILFAENLGFDAVLIGEALMRGKIFD